MMVSCFSAQEQAGGSSISNTAFGIMNYLVQGSATIGSEGSGFIRLVKLEPRLNVITVAEAPLSFRFRQGLAPAVAPSSFRQEVVPYLDFLRTRPATALKTPFQNLLVCAAL